MTFDHYPPTFPYGQGISFNRLEVLPRTDDLDVSLRAETADPLWLLARQRQFGELRGVDGGSPIEVRITATTGGISRLQRGGPSGPAVDVAPTVPLETVVEAEPAAPDGDADLQLAASAGLHWLRLLRAAGVSHLRDTYRSFYAFTTDDVAATVAPTVDPLDGPPEMGQELTDLARRIVGRAPDARRLVADLSPGRDPSGQVIALPDAPSVPAGDEAAVLDAATRFLTWWDGMLPESSAVDGDAWDPHHLEHRFAVQADLDDGPVVLRADEYRGGHLDWTAFTLDEGADLGRPAVPRPGRTAVRSLLPTAVSYPGMPGDRYWAIEDASLRMDELDTGRTDVGRLVLTDLSVLYGHDWFVVPVDLTVGSVCRIDRVEVLDTFGSSTVIDRATGPSWRMFGIDTPDGSAAPSSLLFLPPTLQTSQESEPFEEVGFVRDEMANVVWAIERSYRNGAGFTVDRRQEQQRRASAGQAVAVDAGGAELRYRLMTDVPYHWLPFVAVQDPAAPPSTGAVVLEQRFLTTADADGEPTPVLPRGRLLDQTAYQLAEEEVPRSGTDVIRSQQLARWVDGRYHLWTTRRRRAGRGEATSGLRFDAAVPTT